MSRAPQGVTRLRPRCPVARRWARRGWVRLVLPWERRVLVAARVVALGVAGAGASGMKREAPPALGARDPPEAQETKAAAVAVAVAVAGVGAGGSEGLEGRERAGARNKKIVDVTTGNDRSLALPIDSAP